MGSKDGGSVKIQKAMVDRISNLPDELLSHILSFLPTECAVGTSILSNRWKYLWTAITSLQFELGRIDFEKYQRFTKFVASFFRSFSSSHIQKFSLHIPYIYQNSNVDVTTWIDEAIKRNVSELDIQVYNIKVPLSVFSCSSLKVLTLADNRQLDINIVLFNLPSLKVLHIKGSTRLSGFIETLISSCPELEDLTLSGFLDNEKGNFMVSAPTLKTLQLQLSRNNCISTANRIFVIAPNLEYLHLSDYFVRYKFKGDFSSVVKACVNIGDIYLGGSFRPFQRDLPHRFTFPKFHNLKYLEVITSHDLFWSMLPILIRNSPSVEVLSIQQKYYMLRAEEYTWDGPTFVPKCLRVHITEIKIKGFTGRKHELQLLKYFLGNAKVLQRLTISCSELKQEARTKFCEQLLNFSRASRQCQIEFQGELISN